jgi:L-alanine-DL-glutamate epimerase-like enolase superfamily enzyme
LGSQREERSMKLTGYRIYSVTKGRRMVLLKLLTDEGISGFGELTWHGTQGEMHVRRLKELLDQFVLGKSPFLIEELWSQLYLRPHSRRHSCTFTTPALSAIDIACWDIVGKACNQPVYNLLGGMVNPRLRSYSYLPTQSGDPKAIAESAVEYAERGFTAIKLDPVKGEGTLEECDYVEEVFRTIRAAVGNKCDILLGTHGQLTPHAAIRLAKRLEPFEPAWFEEPVPPENIAEMARVARATTIPIATGERLLTKFEFRELLEQQAASIIQADLTMTGGILEGKKIAAMAECHYAEMAPHHYGGPIALAASIQLDACCTNFYIQEANIDLNTEFLQEPFAWESGDLIPSPKPGLGVDVNEEFLERCSEQVSSDP